MVAWELDGYVVGPVLGRGTAGVIVSARDEATSTDVAIRFLAPDLCASGEVMARFRTDIAQLEVIEQANVAQVYELIERDGQAALVTQLVDGPSLRELLRRGGPLPAEAAVYVMAGMLTGLTAIHGRGILHRAIRPESVLIDAVGVVKLVDVGLAGPGGPAAYAAPEVRYGGPPTVVADLFAAYAVLLECLTGVHGTGDGSAIPPGLRVALSVGLAEQPEARFPDAGAALDQLKLVAATALGPQWYATGRESLVGRIAAPPVAPAPIASPPVAPPAFASLSAMPPAVGTASVFGRASVVAPAPASAMSSMTATQPMMTTASVGTATAAAAAPTVLPVPVSPAVAPLPVRPSSPAMPARTAAGPAPADGQWFLPKLPPSSASPSPMPDSGGGLSGARFSGEPLSGEQFSGTMMDEPEQRRPGRAVRLGAVVAALLVILGGTAWAIASALSPDPAAPSAAITNSHVALVTVGPTVPVASTAKPGIGADTVVPGTPAGLHVTGRSVNSVSLDWASTVDNVQVAGYIILREGKQVGTSLIPGFTDHGLAPQTKYRYAVAAFDAAGNISPGSVVVTAATLADPDVSPPTIPAGLHTTGKSINSIVLAWSAARDNIGVAGYEVYRDGAVIANVAQPSFADSGLAPSSTHTYTVRAFDTSNNASADSAPTTATTLSAPDITAPSIPGGLGAVGTSPSTIDLSWHASSDNVGVTGYQVQRNGGVVTTVPVLSFTDEGLAPGTPYTYAIRAVDAAGNVSGFSTEVVESTTAAPTTPPTAEPTTAAPTPEIMEVALTKTVNGCDITLEVTVSASAPMTSTLTYTVGTDGSPVTVEMTFTTGSLSWTETLPAPDTSMDGTATADAGGKSDNAGWDACPVVTPTSPADPSPGEGE